VATRVKRGKQRAALATAVKPVNPKRPGAAAQAKQDVEAEAVWPSPGTAVVAAAAVVRVRALAVVPAAPASPGGLAATTVAAARCRAMTSVVS
jgi:hypothetical protein